MTPYCFETKVVAPMAKLLGVKVLPLIGPPPDEGYVVHPSLHLLYNRAERTVLYGHEMHQVLPFLPHEMVHCVWAEEMFDGPEDEHAEGLIAYEMLTVLKLCPNNADVEEAIFTAKECLPLGTPQVLRAFFGYADAGAKKAVSAGEVQEWVEGSLPVIWGPREERFYRMYLKSFEARNAS